MTTILFNGSPRRNGNTAFLISELQKRLTGEVIVVDAYSAAVSPCIDCRYCWKHPACAIQDDMQTLYTQIIDAENIVLASPLNFGELTGKLLCVTSRLQMFYSARRFQSTPLIAKKKRGAILLCGGGDGGAATAERTARLVLKEMNADVADIVLSLQTDRVPAREDSVAIEKVHSLAAKLNEGTR